MADSGFDNPGEAAGTTGRPARRLSFSGLVAVMNSIGTCWIFVLLVLINTDIIGRTAFNSPLAGVNEIVGMSIVGCVFLQLAHALRMGRLTRSDVILAKLGSRPRLRLGMEAAYSLLGAAMLVILLVYTWPMLVHAWTIGEYEGSAGGFTAPVWPIKLIIVIGCVAAVAQCLLNSFEFIRKISTAATGGRQQ